MAGLVLSPIERFRLRSLTIFTRSLMNDHTRAIETRLQKSLNFVNKRIRKTEENLAKAYKERHEIEKLIERLKKPE